MTLFIVQLYEHNASALNTTILYFRPKKK